MSDRGARGEQAQRLLDDEVLKEAFAEVRADLLHDWENTPEEASDRREGIWRSIKSIDRLQGKLRSYVLDGRLSQAR